MKINELDYVLPPEAVATHPAEPRDHSRLLVYRRGADAVSHHRFYELPGLLEPSDLLVLNDTRVLPAKLVLRKATGALITGLFLREEAAGRWTVMLRSRGKLAPGAVLTAERRAGGSGGAERISLRLVERTAGEKGQWVAEVTPARPAAEVLAAIGHVPLPPYIEKARAAETHGTGPQEEAGDFEKYQTVYAREAGSLAAPTAGLHFTPALLAALAAREMRTAGVTLHVGLGTFLPVEAATLEAHRMHVEEWAMAAETVAALRAQRAAGGRIVAVGTTATRTLEAAAEEILDTAAPGRDLRGATDLLISPGYRFRLVDVLITNFHLPRSTLLALVAALIPLPRLKELYAEAIREGYRFYSYGDAMLILP